MYDQRPLCEVLRPQISTTRQGIIGRHESDELVAEELTGHHTRGLHLVMNDRQVQPLLQHRLDGGVRRLGYDLQINLRKIRPEATENPRQPVITRIALGGDPQHAPIARAQLPEIVLHPLQLLQNRSRRLQQPSPLHRDLHATALAVEQGEAQPPLQLLQTVAHGGLGQMQSARRAGDRPLTGDGVHHLQVRDIQDHLHLLSTMRQIYRYNT